MTGNVEGNVWVAVVSPNPKKLSEAVRNAGGEPIEVEIPSGVPGWGVALQREWVSDALEIRLADKNLDALLFSADTEAALSGVLITALRLDIPAVCASPPETSLAAAVATLGFTSLNGEDAAEVVVRLATKDDGVPAVTVDNFSIANALRVGLSLGCGAETVMHIAAIGRQAGVVGFKRMMEVLVSESYPVCRTEDTWFREHGLPAVLDDLTDELHDTQTVSGSLKDFATFTEEDPPGAGFGYAFIQAKSSRAEMICTVPDGVTEFSALCRVFDSEEDAVSALMETSGEDEPHPATSETGDGDESQEEESAVNTDERMFLVVRRCGAKGEPGVRVLHDLARVIKEEGLEERVGVITDGLAPEGASGVWASAFSPEAASSGVIGRLEDEDFIKLDFEEGRILTSIPAKDLARRRLARPAAPASPVYVVRYARSARSSLDGGAFG